jgi:tRNA (guanine-N7-)-methyltransferase
LKDDTHSPECAAASETLPAAEGRRSVRSFVLRGSRLTVGQKRALDELWPRFGVDREHGQLDFEDLFGNRHPVIMEIGFGNGDATWRMALAYPEENYLGVEVHRPGIGHLLLKLEEHGIGNVRVNCEDAVELLRERIPDAALAGIRIFFPDPWPKQRHHKRRLLQPPFVDLLARRLRAGGQLHLATDWKPYAEHMLEVIGGDRRFENVAGAGRFAARPEWRPQTRFERRGQRLGHAVYDLLYQRAQRDAEMVSCQGPR